MCYSAHSCSISPPVAKETPPSSSSATIGVREEKESKEREREILKINTRLSHSQSSLSVPLQVTK